MKAMDLLKHLNGVDPAYVEEASDHGVLAYRRRQKRARLAAAACLAAAVFWLLRPSQEQYGFDEFFPPESGVHR